MTIIQDPAGGVFAIWQPGVHVGARRVNDPGCLTWNELQGWDPEAAVDFFSGLFDWEMEPIEEGGKLAYVVIIKNAGSSNGGIMPMTEQHGDAPPHWLAYFTVPSCEEAVAKVWELGGLLDFLAGRIAVVHDPKGAVFALFDGETDD
jgi:predicted enzyme related to lactoylglutathione lyase